MGPIVLTNIRVRYGETDQMGFVFNSHYLSWFEIGRTEYCRALSRPYRLWEEGGCSSFGSSGITNFDKEVQFVQK